MALYRRARSTRVLVISLVMASLLTITIDFRGGDSGPLESVGRGALAVIGPMQNVVSNVLRPVGGFFSGLIHVGSLNDENNRLQSEVSTLRHQLAEGSSRDRRLEELTKLLNLQQGLELTEVAGAMVIARSVNNFEWSVMINAGSSSGVQKDMPVVNGDGLVGRVVEVARTTSKVQLIIDPRAAVAVRLATSGETGLLQGARENDLRMDLVDKDVQVEPDEQVITSSYDGGLYPPNIPVGVVSHVYDNPGGLDKLIEVRPGVDFSALEFVMVVAGS